MVDHCLAVGRDLHIALDRVVSHDGGAKCRRRILNDASRGVVQSAVSDRSCGQPVRHGGTQLTSNSPSTSTAESSGSTGTPTVVRAWRPLSPKAATIRSDAPFITLGPSRNVGIELMKPPRRITRTT